MNRYHHFDTHSCSTTTPRTWSVMRRTPTNVTPAPTRRNSRECPCRQRRRPHHTRPPHVTRHVLPPVDVLLHRQPPATQQQNIGI